MLVRVASTQARFTLPGLRRDDRGVTVGPDAVVRASTLDRLVAFLRLLSGERCPDELWAGLTVAHARIPGGMREVLVRFPSPPSELLDLAAGFARIAGVSIFVGAGAHFVPYRDRRSPVGYDVTALASPPAELHLYGEGQDAPFGLEGGMPLEELVRRLGLVADPAQTDEALARAPRLIVTSRRGLQPHLLAVLLRAGVRARAALSEPMSAGPGEEPPAFWTFVVEGLPARLVPLARRTPGLRLYREATEHLLIAAGYRHPLHLERCARDLMRDRLVFLEPPPMSAVEVAPPPPFVSLEDLARFPVSTVSAAPSPKGSGGRARARREPPSLELRFTLRAARTDAGRVRGALIAARDHDHLCRLVYALPPRVLAEHRAAVVGDDLLLLSSERIEAIPLGIPLFEAAPFVLLPAGFELAPRLPPERLAAHLGGGEGRYCLVLAADQPIHVVNQRDLAPLERWILLRMPPGSPRSGPPPLESASTPLPPEVVHDPVGFFPLWGLPRRGPIRG